MVDAPDSKSGSERSEGSIPSLGTKWLAIDTIEHQRNPHKHYVLRVFCHLWAMLGNGGYKIKCVSDCVSDYTKHNKKHESDTQIHGNTSKYRLSKWQLSH